MNQFDSACNLTAAADRFKAHKISWVADFKKAVSL